jgi:hypothetical protein
MGDTLFSRNEYTYGNNKEDYLVRYGKNFFKSKEIFKSFRAWGNHWSG